MSTIFPDTNPLTIIKSLFRTSGLDPWEEVDMILDLASIPQDELEEMVGKGFDIYECQKIGQARRKQREWEELARSSPVSRSRPTNGRRRTRRDVEQIRAAIYLTLKGDHPMTVRQLFYRLVSDGTIAKTEGEYKQTVVRLTAEMRLAGLIPFGWIADNTRWMRKPRTHSSLADALQQTARTYRRSVWEDQDAYVEVWLEKDALAGVLYDVTAAWDVPLMVTRGFASLSFLYEAADAIQDQGKPAFLYYFGDHDPSGLDIPRTVEQRIREFAPEAAVTFERVAVTPQQIEELALPTRPTKKTDSRSKGFEGDSVEVDAIKPATLRRMVEECITQHIDRDAYDRLMAVEAAERETLMAIVKDAEDTAF
jgi:hypothetical protein